MVASDPYAARPPEPDAWGVVADRLGQRLAMLGDGETLTVTGPADSARPTTLRLAAWFGLRPARVELARPWLRLERVEDQVRGVCPAPESEGGTFRLTAAESAAVVALGWHRTHPAEGRELVRWWPDDVPRAAYLSGEDRTSVVTCVLETMRTVFGVRDAAGVELGG